MRVASSLLSVFFLVVLLASPTPSLSQKGRPAHYEVNDAIHFEASVPETEPAVTHELAVLFDVSAPLSATGGQIKFNPSSVTHKLSSAPRLHVKLRVFRN